MMRRNEPGQRWKVFAFDTSNNPVTGDEGNITADIRLDDGGLNPTDDTNPAPLGKGFYEFLIDIDETIALKAELFPETTSGGVKIVPVPATEKLESPKFRVS
jgi:hypothetical protein